MYKKTLLLFVVVILFSCKSEPTVSPVSSPTAVNGNVIVEQTESSTEMIIGEGWTQQDWESVHKGVKKEEMFTKILELVKAGKVNAYDYILPEKKLSYDDIDKMLNRIDTLILDDPEQPGKTVRVTSPINIKPADVSQIRTLEQWVFDEETHKMTKVVTDIAFFRQALDEDGHVKGHIAIFAVKL